MNLFAGQQSKCRHAEQTCGQSRGRRGWKKLRDECWNTHITIWRTKLLLFSHSVAQSCPTLCDPVVCSTPGCTVQHQLLELAQTHVHWDGDAIQPSQSLSSPSPPDFSLSQHKSQLFASVFWWPKHWSFSFSISPSNEYSGLISFRIDWLDLLAVQGTLKSLLQHQSSKALILQRSALFIVQLSHPYLTTGNTTALTIWTIVGKLMSLLFNVLSRFVIAFLPRSKCLLISWLQSPSAVISEPKKINKQISGGICCMMQGARALCSVTQRGGMWWHVERRFRREGAYAHLWLTHADVWQKQQNIIK